MVGVFILRYAIFIPDIFFILKIIRILRLINLKGIIMKDNIIYGLYCPNTEKPVYIGRSKKGIKRPFDHIKGKSHSEKVKEWVEILKADSQNPVLVILEQDFIDDYANEKELFWINKFINDGYILLNQNGIKPYYFYHSHTNVCDEIDYLHDVRLFIKIKRKTLNLTQKELSEKSGIGLRFIREIEQSSKTNFQTDTIYKLCRFLGMGNMSFAFTR